MTVLLDAVQWLLVIAFAGCLAGFVLALTRRSRAAAPVAEPIPGEASKNLRDAPTGPVYWRCEHCGRRWRSQPGSGGSTVALRVRRRIRRRARARKNPVPEWAKARGSDRCPSCLSTEIRLSRQQD